MTKAVRIENADLAPYKVLVEIWEKSYPEGAGVADKLVETITLGYPTAMTDSRIYLTSSRYLVVKEAPQ